MTLIWDCFFFNNELDILETRLYELEHVVDRFVIVEGDRTHSGSPKPSIFNQNRERFGRWADRIQHVVAQLDAEIRSPRAARARDDQQRAALGRHLADATGSDDLIFVSDLDEIIDRDVVGYLAGRRDAPIRLRMDHGIYHANWLMPRPWSNGTLAFRGDQLGEKMVLQRLGRPQTDWDGYEEIQLDDAGAHLSFLGGVDTIRKKFTAYSDDEFNDIRFHGAPHLERCMDYGIHYQGRDVLRRLRRSELSPLLRRLSEHPPSSSFFDFTEPPLSGFQAAAYCGYTWLRTNVGRVPAWFLGMVDRRPGLVTGPGAPAFWALDAVLRLRRRLRPVNYWALTSGVDPTARTRTVVRRWR